MITDIYIHGVDKYKKEGSEDEWYFSNLSDEALENATNFEVFGAIDNIVEIALTEPDAYIFYNLIQFIITLAHKSNTTESPVLLKLNYESLQSTAKQFGQAEYNAVNELGRYFRIKPSYSGEIKTDNK